MTSTSPPDDARRGAESPSEPDEMQAMHDAFLAALAGSGTLGKLRAQLRTAAIGIVRGDERGMGIMKPVKPAAQREDESERTALLLVADLLRVGGFACSAGVFEEEASLGGDSDAAEENRERAAAALGLSSSASSGGRRPLLVELVAQALQRGQEVEAVRAAGDGSTSREAALGDPVLEAPPTTRRAVVDATGAAVSAAPAGTMVGAGVGASSSSELELSVPFSDVSDEASLEEGSGECDIVETPPPPVLRAAGVTPLAPATAQPAPAAGATSLPSLALAAAAAVTDNSTADVYDDFEDDDDTF